MIIKSYQILAVQARSPAHKGCAVGAEAICNCKRWIDLTVTGQNKEPNSPTIEFFDVFRQFQEDHVPATVRNPFFLNFNCQPGTGRKLAQMMRARTPVRHCQYGNLKMTATDVNDIKIMKFDIN